MAHGKHRRARATTQRNPKVASFKARLREGLQVSVDELLRDVEQEVPAGRGPLADRTEQAFCLVACIHPGTCKCGTEYPNWKPGLR